MKSLITYLLEDALDEIDNLQDYYNSQYRHVDSYVKTNVEKYKYGVVLDNFFLNLVTKQHE